MQRVASRILKDPQSAEDTVSEAMIKIIKNVDIIDDIESKKCANFVSVSYTHLDVVLFLRVSLTA